MKIAAFADIHGNYQALLTVLDHVERWQPDLVLVLGDIINRGPRSRDCLHLVLEKAQLENWQVIKGNHEGYVLDFNDPAFSRSGIEFELRKIIFWTYQSLSAADIQAVIDLPDQVSLQAEDGQLVSCRHASLAGDRVGIYPYSTAEDLKHLADPAAGVFVVGHTHQPLVKTWGDTLIINAGSVGLPFDGDKRAAYAQLWSGREGWSAEIIRLEYDLPAAAREYETSGFLAEGGPLAELVLAELKLAWPQLNHWFRRYEQRVLSGGISPQAAVREFLQNPHIEQILADVPQSFPGRG